MFLVYTFSSGSHGHLGSRGFVEPPPFYRRVGKCSADEWPGTCLLSVLQPSDVRVLGILLQTLQAKASRWTPLCIETAVRLKIHSVLL